MMEQEVLKFIKHFELGKDCFLYGCCFWFASILIQRFSPALCELMYNTVENHFAVKIDGILYDASGKISLQGFIPWANVYEEDSLLYDQIIQDCVLMKD